MNIDLLYNGLWLTKVCFTLPRPTERERRRVKLKNHETLNRRQVYQLYILISVL